MLFFTFLGLYVCFSLNSLSKNYFHHTKSSHVIAFASFIMSLGHHCQQLLDPSCYTIHMQDRGMFFSLKIKALAFITSLAMPLAFVQSSQLTCCSFMKPTVL